MEPTIVPTLIIDPASIQITVTNDLTRGARVNYHGHPEPTLTSVMSLLPQHSTLLAQYTGYSLRDTIWYTRGVIPNQEWANAIAVAIYRENQGAQPATAVTPDALPPAILALGDTIYRLYPIQTRRLNSALTGVRRHIVEKAQREAQLIVADAQKAATSILTNANKLKEEYLKAYSKAAVPPAWAIANNIPLKYSDNRWWGILTFNFSPARWMIHLQLSAAQYKAAVPTFSPAYDPVNCYYELAWKSVPNSHYITAIVQIPLGGELNVSYIRNAHRMAYLPHISAHGCMGISDAPKKMETFDHWAKLVDGLIRTMNAEINLGSLLTQPPSWPAGVIQMAPKCLQDFFPKVNVGTASWHHLSGVKPDTCVNLTTFNNKTFNAAHLDNIEEAR